MESIPRENGVSGLLGIDVHARAANAQRVARRR